MGCYEFILHPGNTWFEWGDGSRIWLNVCVHPNMLNPNSPCDSVRGVSLLGQKPWVFLDGISVLKNKNFIEHTLLPEEDTVRRISELGSETRCQLCWCLELATRTMRNEWLCLNHSTYDIFVLIDWMDKEVSSSYRFELGRDPEIGWTQVVRLVGHGLYYWLISTAQ